MEIQISDGIVREVKGGITAPNTYQAILARTIASHLPIKCLRAGAKIAHNSDELYTGIRFETRAGAVVLEMPTNRGDGFRVIHERLTETPEERVRALQEEHANRVRKAAAVGKPVPEFPELDPAAPDTEPVKSVEIARFPSLYKPAGIAFMIGDLLMARGFLA